MYWGLIESFGLPVVSKSYEWGGIVGVAQEVVDDVVGAASAVAGWTLGAIVAIGDGALGWTGIHIGVGGTIGVIAGVAVFAVAGATSGTAAAVVFAVVTGVEVGAVLESMISTRPLEPEELVAAWQVYGDTLPDDKRRMTNPTSVNGAMFTVPGADGLIYCNMGGLHDDPGGTRASRVRPYQALIHELAHAQQIDRGGFVGQTCARVWTADHVQPWWDSHHRASRSRRALESAHQRAAGRRRRPLVRGSGPVRPPAGADRPVSLYYGHIWYQVLGKRPSATAPVNLPHALYTAIPSVEKIETARRRSGWYDLILAFWVDGNGAIMTSTGEVDALNQPVRWNGMQPFQPAGTATQGAVSVVSRRPGRIDVFWIDPTGGIGSTSSDASGGGALGRFL